MKISTALLAFVGRVVGRGWIRRQLHSWLFAATALALWGAAVLAKAYWIFIPATIWFW